MEQKAAVSWVEAGCFVSTFTSPLSPVMSVCAKAVFQNAASHSSREHDAVQLPQSESPGRSQIASCSLDSQLHLDMPLHAPLQ